LEEKNGRFKSRPESCKSDTRLICPINVVILDSVKSYFNKYFNQPKEMKFVLARISDLEARNIKVDNFHERSFKK